VGGSTGFTSGPSLLSGPGPGFIQPFAENLFGQGQREAETAMTDTYQQLGLGETGASATRKGVQTSPGSFGAGSTAMRMDLGQLPSLTGGIPEEFKAGLGEVQNAAIQSSGSGGGGGGGKGGSAGGALSALGGLAAKSDIRLKRDITPVGKHNGINLYRYRYLWSDTTYVGVMAHEVAEIVPEAVLRDADGYLSVNYARLGLRLLTWDEWIAAGATTWAA
jgi:hypothetical protein